MSEDNKKEIQERFKVDINDTPGTVLSDNVISGSNAHANLENPIVNVALPEQKFDSQVAERFQNRLEDLPNVVNLDDVLPQDAVAQSALDENEKAKLSWKQALRAYIQGDGQQLRYTDDEAAITWLLDESQNKEAFAFYVTDFDINNLPKMDFSGVPSPLSAQEVQEALEKGQVIDHSGSINSLSLDKIKQNMDTIRQNSDDSTHNENKPKA